jgi:hypothetical protein
MSGYNSSLDEVVSEDKHSATDQASRIAPRPACWGSFSAIHTYAT